MNKIFDCITASSIPKANNDQTFLSHDQNPICPSTENIIREELETIAFSHLANKALRKKGEKDG
jgi:hypothetical protein